MISLTNFFDPRIKEIHYPGISAKIHCLEKHLQIFRIPDDSFIVYDESDIFSFTGIIIDSHDVLNIPSVILRLKTVDDE